MKALGSAAKAGSKVAGNAAKSGAKVLAKKGVDAAAHAAKSALDGDAEKEEVEEGYKPTPFEKMERQSYKHRKAEEDAVRKGDGEGATKHMKRRLALGSPLSKRTELINKGKGPANEMTRKASLKKEELEATGLFSEEEIDVILERLDDMPAGDVGHEIHKKAMKANQSAIDAVNKTKGKDKKKSVKESYADMYKQVYEAKQTAMDIVRKQVEDKYGKGAIHDPNAPKKEVSPEEKKRRAAEEAKNREARRKESGYDPMHSPRD